MSHMIYNIYIYGNPEWTEITTTSKNVNYIVWTSWMNSLIIFDFSWYCQLLWVRMFKTPYTLSIFVIPLYSPDNLGQNSTMVLSRLFYCYLFYFLNCTCVSFVVLVVTLWKNIFAKSCLDKWNFVVVMVFWIYIYIYICVLKCIKAWFNLNFSWSRIAVTTITNSPTQLKQSNV